MTCVPLRRRSRPVYLLALVVLLVAAISAGPGAAQVLLLPLGDSITHGGAGDGGVVYPTYRGWLYQELMGLGYDVDFVGSLDQPDIGASLDPDNEGHSGYTTGDVLAELPLWLGEYPPPGIALVHLGTNDVIRGVPPAETVRNIASIITVLRERNPSITILVAQIIPTSVGSTNAEIETLNGQMAGLAAFSTPQSPILVVDHYTGYDGVADNQRGGVHPGLTGEWKMTSAWQRALIPVVRATMPGGVTTVPTPVITTAIPVITEPTVVTLPTVVTAPASSRFGPRAYRIGQVPSRPISTPSDTGAYGSPSTRALSPGTADTTSATPPTRPFTRWYPAIRWSSGPR